MIGFGARELRAWLPVVLCIGLIWTFSSEGFGAQGTSRYLRPFLRWLHPEITWQQIAFVHLVVRKAAHVTEYALLAMLTLRALRLTLDLSLSRLVAIVMGLVVVVASADELRQSLLPMRTGSATDVLLDVIGGLLGVGILVLFYRRLGVVTPVPKAGT